MEFDFPDRKLPKEASLSLRSQPTESFEPLVPVMVPLYVHLKLNEKFVLVKHPLDFFLGEELDRLRSCGSFFLPPEPKEATRFRSVARVARSLLSWKPESREGERPILQPASYEVSDALLRLTAPLWGTAEPGTEGAKRDLGVDLLGGVFFASELCDRIPGELLQLVRNRSIRSYLRAQFCSSWVIFLGVHLGYCDLGYLNRLRLRAFELEGLSAPEQEPLASARGEPDELLRLARQGLPDRLPALLGTLIEARQLLQGPCRTSIKLAARMERVERLAHA